MFRLGVVVFLCAQAFARPSGENVEIDPHIVGGTPAPEGQFPFIVSLRQSDNQSFCGGALLSKSHVLTAAHCVYEKKELRIGAGSVKLSQQKIVGVEKIIIHEGFNPVRTNNDIAILKLQSPVPIGGNIQLINFPVTQNITGRNVTALGWGRTTPLGLGSYPTTLMYLNRRVLDNEDCSKKISFQIASSQVCIEGEKNYGMCFGDSGSPLLFKGSYNKNYVAGIVSWGIPCAKGFPDVFTRVSSFTQWIKEKMA